jgi:hypothetical protein
MAVVVAVDIRITLGIRMASMVAAEVVELAGAMTVVDSHTRPTVALAEQAHLGKEQQVVPADQVAARVLVVAVAHGAVVMMQALPAA